MSNVDPNQCNRHGESLLHYCSGLGYLDILKFLHQKGADINVTDDRGDSIVHWCARQNHPSIIRYFYDTIANINQFNKNLETPLHVAARYGHVEAIEQLCKCGANVNAIDEHGETAMLIAVWHGFPKIVHILGEVGAQTDIKNKEGETALHVASARGHIECVRCLLEAGARTDVRNKNSYTPLHLSLKRQHVGVAQLILRAGADIEAVDDRGERPIHYASRSNLLQICQHLCSLGCNVNASNKSGLYPLHLAAKNGHIEIVRCLCLAGSIVDQKNRDAIIPQICAIAQNHNEIADLLTRLRNEQTKEEYILQLSSSSGGSGSGSNNNNNSSSISQPIQRFKLKIMGHSGSGKTTLIESLKCGYFSSWFRRSTKSMNQSPQPSKMIPEFPSNGWSSTTTTTTDPSSTPTTPTTPISTITAQFEANLMTNHRENCTLGIDCQQVTISGVGDMSIWEFSGNESYYQIYDHFVGSNNCLHAIVFRLCDRLEVQIHSIMFWLYFLQSRTPVTEPLTYCGKSSKPSKVIIIATHADLVSGGTSSDEIQSNLKTIMQSVGNKFDHIFDIHEHIFVMDAMAVGSPAMKQLKQHLSSMKPVVLQGIPHSTGFLESVMTFLNICRKASTNFPVLSSNQFKEIIRSQINPLASDEHFKEILLQLQTMGEVLYLKAKTENSQDLIVLNPRWLTIDIIGNFLSRDYNCKSRITGTYSIDDIQMELPDTDALDLLQVLEAISLCIQCDHEGDIAYEFPCFILREPIDDIWPQNNIIYADGAYCGVRIQCEPEVPSGQILVCLFSRIQICLRSAVKSHPDFEVYELYNWFKQTKLTVGPLEALITANAISESIEVRLRGPKHMRIECFLFMEDILNIIDTSVSQICPGFVFERHYFSPKHLSEHKENLSSYSSYSILKALLSSDNSESVVKQTIKSSDSVIEEKISDIICFGIDDINSIRRTNKFTSIPSFSSLMSSPVSSPAFKWTEGGPTLVPSLHSSNLSLLTKQRLCAVLDPPEPIGRDWCMLGILLGMTDKLPKLDPGANAQLSPTARVIDECIREPTSTIRVLVKKLEELTRIDAIDVILKTGPLFRIFPTSSQPEGCLPYNDETGTVSSGISSGSQASSSNLSR
ncbi:death-associated protein kinase 1-like isoform X2 [Oppia nitens]|nr:death-associated protein kinase 1-like isoform X2 [Oppia nitens]